MSYLRVIELFGFLALPVCAWKCLKYRCGCAWLQNKSGITLLLEEHKLQWFCYYQARCSRGCSTNTFVIHKSINSVILFLQIFARPSFPNHRNLGAKIGRGSSTPTHVTCHMLHITCHMSHDMFVLYNFVDLVEGGSVINRAFPFYFTYDANKNNKFINFEILKITIARVEINLDFAYANASMK